MKSLFLGATAVLECPLVGLFLLLGWRNSWLARSPSLTWTIAAMVLSAWCVFVVKSLASRRNSSGVRENLGHESRTRVAADKIGMALVAVVTLWILFLGLDTNAALKMFRATGVVNKVEHGRAEVAFNFSSGNPAGYDFPERDNFSTLRAGESVALLSEGETTGVASRVWVFTVFGGLLARRSLLQPPRTRAIV